jgi:endogenous inhibitor of DNA gyrase (YacG/DUF329 family)
MKLCPQCKKPALPRSENRFYPFCSERCRTVDLGKWLGEEYRVPAGTADEQEDELPTIPGDQNAETEH